MAAPAAVPTDDVRLLRRVDIEAGPTEHVSWAMSWAAVIDVETTGLDPNTDQIIELAVRRIGYTAEGAITHVGPPHAWLEDPGRPLDDVIVRLTGLTDEALRGHLIEDDKVLALLGRASIIIAHNASFDRPHLERRFPTLRGKAWACSCREVDWAARGFEDGRKLGWLLAQAGWFIDAHRATADVDAVIQMLSHDDGERGTALGELVATASEPGWIVQAVGAHFDVKDQLKARGYRWNSEDRCWWSEVRDRDLAKEESWLADHVYHPSARPRASGPGLERVDWTTRHG